MGVDVHADEHVDEPADEPDLHGNNANVDNRNEHTDGNVTAAISEDDDVDMNISQIPDDRPSVEYRADIEDEKSTDTEWMRREKCVSDIDWTTDDNAGTDTLYNMDTETGSYIDDDELDEEEIEIETNKVVCSNQVTILAKMISLLFPHTKK